MNKTALSFQSALILLLLLFLPVTAGIAQEEMPTPELEITGVNATGLPEITVHTNIFDSLRQPVLGLTASDFTLSGELLDRGQIVRVENITDDNLPFATVLTIDTSTSMEGLPIARAKEAARTFVNSIGPNDPIAIVTFSTTTRVIQDYTTDKAVLLDTIDSIVAGGQTALYDAGLVGVQLATEAPLPRRTVILLSDGAEFGGVSIGSRPDALDQALIRGVPVHTIGLGFGVDRTYLQELAIGTNARFHESPTPEQLVSIYSDLANLLRSQYVITLHADLPADGSTYTLMLQADTPQGATNQVSATIRTPIPVPIVSLSDTTLVALPDAPISEAVEIVVDVRADDDLAALEFTLDGEVVSDTNSVTIDPATLEPGIHTLTFTAIDVNGDTGSTTLEFEVAALPSEVTIVSDLATGEIDSPQTISLSVSGQTPPVSATFSIDGTVAAVVETEPFEFTIDPAALAPGEHELGVAVLNAGGVTTTVDQPFTVAALPPVVTVGGLTDGQVVDEPLTVTVQASGQTPITDITFTLDDGSISAATGEDTATFTIFPMTLPPGANTFTVTVTEASGTSTTVAIALEVAALPPDIDLSGIDVGEVLEENRVVTLDILSQTPVSSATFSLNGEVVDTQSQSPFSLELDALELSPGPYILSVEVTNQSGLSDTAEIAFAIGEGPAQTATALAPTATPLPSRTPQPTDTAEPTDTAASTDTEEPTDTVEPTDTEVPPTDTAAPTDTNIPPTDAPAPTDTEVPPTDTAQATDTEVPPTDTAAPTDTEMPPTDTAAPTDTEVPPTDTLEPTDTDVPPTVASRVTEVAQAAIAAGTETQQAVDAQATVDTEATDSGVAVTEGASPEATEVATERPPTATVLPTEEATQSSARETPTPIGTLQVVVQDAPPADSDLTPVIAIVAAIVVLVLALIIYNRQRGQGGQ